MRIKVILWIAFFCIQFVQCRRDLSTSTRNNDQNDMRSTYDSHLMVGDSTKIAVIVDTSRTPNLTFQWQVNLVRIEGQGKEITFVAPSKCDTSTVHLRVLSSDVMVYEKFFPIYVYKQVVLLKADDMAFAGSGIIAAQWHRFFEFVKSKNIKAGIGIIGYSLFEGNADYLTLLDSLQSSGYFELFNHGFTHNSGINDSGGTYYEFCNTPYEIQSKHMIASQNLARAKLNITLHAFGAPADRIDANTLRVVDESDDINVWFNGNPNSKKVILKEFGCHIETPAFYPSYQKFIQNYDPNRAWYLFDLHPNIWDEQRFNEFKKIIEYLIQNNVTFIMPDEYYRFFCTAT